MTQRLLAMGVRIVERADGGFSLIVGNEVVATAATREKAEGIREFLARNLISAASTVCGPHSAVGPVEVKA